MALNGTRSALAEERPCVAVRGELVPMVSLRNLFRDRRPVAAAARITVDATRRPAGRRRRRPAAGPRPGGHPVPGRGPARPQPLFRSHDPGRRLRLPDPRSISPGVRITIRRAECPFHALGRREGGEFPMRLTLRTQITTALVLFGLVPASIVGCVRLSCPTTSSRTSRSSDHRQAAAYDQRPLCQRCSQTQIRAVKEADDRSAASGCKTGSRSRVTIDAIGRNSRLDRRPGLPRQPDNKSIADQAAGE